MRLQLTWSTGTENPNPPWRSLFFPRDHAQPQLSTRHISGPLLPPDFLVAMQALSIRWQGGNYRVMSNPGFGLVALRLVATVAVAPLWLSV